MAKTMSKADKPFAIVFMFNPFLWVSLGSFDCPREQPVSFSFDFLLIYRLPLLLKRGKTPSPLMGHDKQLAVRGSSYCFLDYQKTRLSADFWVAL